MCLLCTLLFTFVDSKEVEKDGGIMLIGYNYKQQDPERRYICPFPQCHKSLTPGKMGMELRKNATGHTTQVHGWGVCPGCGKAFEFKEALMKHFKRHSDHVAGKASKFIAEPSQEWSFLHKRKLISKSITIVRKDEQPESK